MPGTSLTAYIISLNPLNQAAADILILQMKKLRLRYDNLSRDTRGLRFAHSPVYSKPTLCIAASA